MKVMWKQLLQPHVDYCSQLHFTDESNDLTQIENLQRTFSRKIHVFVGRVLYSSTDFHYQPFFDIPRLVLLSCRIVLRMLLSSGLSSLSRLGR